MTAMLDQTRDTSGDAAPGAQEPQPSRGALAGLKVIDLTRVLGTEGTDYPLLPNDVLYVPRRKPMSQTLSRLGLLGTSVIPSLLIYTLLR